MVYEKFWDHHNWACNCSRTEVAAGVLEANHALKGQVFVVVAVMAEVAVMVEVALLVDTGVGEDEVASHLAGIAEEPLEQMTVVVGPLDDTKADK